MVAFTDPKFVLGLFVLFVVNLLVVKWLADWRRNHLGKLPPLPAEPKDEPLGKPASEPDSAAALRAE